MEKPKLVSSIVIESIFFVSLIVRILLTTLNVFYIKPFDFVFDVAALILVWVPSVFEKITKIKLNMFTVYCYFLLIILSTFIGSIWKVYSMWHLYDFFVHIVCSVLITFIAYTIFKASKNNKLNTHWIFILVLATTLSCGLLWEVWEFLVDSILKLNTQRYKDIYDNVFVGQHALFDTMTDMIADLVGAVIGCLILLFTSKNKKQVEVIDNASTLIDNQKDNTSIQIDNLNDNKNKEKPNKKNNKSE